MIQRPAPANIIWSSLSHRSASCLNTFCVECYGFLVISQGCGSKHREPLPVGMPRFLKMRCHGQGRVATRVLALFSSSSSLLSPPSST